MNDIDGQNTEFADDEGIQITDLDESDSPRQRQAEHLIGLTRKYSTIPWMRSGLAWTLVLILLGILLLQWPRSASTTSNMARMPAPYFLNATTTRGLIFIQSSDHTLAAYQATTSQRLWHINLPATATLIAINQMLYSYSAASPDKTVLEALNANNGAVIWHATFPASLINGSYEISNAQPSPIFFSNGTTLFIESVSGLIYALQASTGQVKWTHQTDNISEQRASLQVQDNLVLFVAANSTLHMLNANTGQDIVDLPARYGLSPTIDGQMIYALPPPGVSPLQAFHAPDGKQLWTYALPKGTWAQTEKNGIVYLGAAGGATLIALRGSDGHKLWTYQADDGQAMVNTFFAENGIGYLLQQNATLVSIRISDGAVLWRSHIPELQNQITETTTFFMDKGVLVLFNQYGSASIQPTPTYALRASDGKILWRNAKMLASPSPLADVLYTLQSSGQLDVWRASNGQHLWSYSAPAGTNIIWSLWPISTLLFLQDSTGSISALRISDGKLLWRYL